MTLQMTWANKTLERDNSTALCKSAPGLPIWREAFFGFEWLALRCSAIYNGLGVTHGDNSPIILVPGLFATDSSLNEMRYWLGRLGYRALKSGIGLNARCPQRSVDLLVKTVDRVYSETGEKVTLIGHSLGGLLARGAALRRPSKVAAVISLGSPVNGVAAHPFIVAAAVAARGSCDGECFAELQTSLPRTVSETCIYSKQDGVVDWRTCWREDATSIEVPGTHLGLVLNTSVYRR